MLIPIGYTLLGRDLIPSNKKGNTSTMPLIYATLIFTVFINSALGFSNAYTPGSPAYCNQLLPNSSLDNAGCNQKSFHYGHDFNSLLEGSTSINYTLEKDITTEKASMIANYYQNGFIAQILGSYEKDITANDSYSSDAIINMTYQTKPLEALTTTISESIILPAQSSNADINPPSYTSILEAHYSMDNMYKLFAQSSYTYLDKPKKSSNAPLSNPYSFETGISYTKGKRISYRASYSQVKDKDPTLKVNKIATLAFNRKINKKIKTSLTIRKNFTSYPPEHKAAVKINYAF